MTQGDQAAGMLIGYARVSTHEQSLDLQLDSLREAGSERIYDDTVSGVKVKRPGLDQLRQVLRRGDTLVVWRLDRLGRSLKDLLAWSEWLDTNGIALRSLQEQIDTSSPSGRLVFHLFAALAEFERNLIIERTEAGRASARIRGRMGGRPRKLSSAQVRQLRIMHADGSASIKEICHTLGIGRKTLYRYLDGNSTTTVHRGLA